MSEPAAEGAVEIPLESVPNDLDDDAHKSLDKEVLEFLPPDHEPNDDKQLTQLLLAIVLCSHKQLDPNYATFLRAKALLVKHPKLVDKLTVAWRAGSFKEIRNLSTYKHPLDSLGAII